VNSSSCGSAVQTKADSAAPTDSNAGNSPTGAAWAARHADFNFISFADLEGARNYTVRSSGPPAMSMVVTSACSLTVLVICRDTEKEAEEVHRQIVEMGDWQAANNMMSVLGIQSGSFTEQFRGPMAESIVAGGGAPRLSASGTGAEYLAGSPRRGLTAYCSASSTGTRSWYTSGHRFCQLLEQSRFRNPCRI